MKLSIIISCRNNEDNIKHLIDNLEKINIPKEVIVVDDGSTDSTPEILERIKDQGRITLAAHKQRLGKGASVRIGLEKATGDIIIIQDAESAYNPLDYYKLIEPFRFGVNVVYGTRWNTNSGEDAPAKATLGNKIILFMSNMLFGYGISDMRNGCKVIRSNALKDMALESKGDEFSSEMTAKLIKRGYGIKEVPLPYGQDKANSNERMRLIKDLASAWALVRYKFKEEARTSPSSGLPHNKSIFF